ncbi:MAG: ATP synthase F1 subunit delta, partial [Candidatus Oleimicrobiaceae bacterium]
TAAAYAHITAGWVAQLRQLWEKLSADPALLAGLSDVRRDFAARQRECDSLLPPDLNRDARNLVYVMLRDGQLRLLGGVVEQLAVALADRGRQDVARVVTAVSLSPKEQEALRAQVRKRFGQGVAVRFEVEPDILGGVIIKVGDKVVDGSLAGRLAALHQRLRGSR